MFVWPNKEMAVAGAKGFFCSSKHLYEIEIPDDTVVLAGLPGMFSSKGDHFWKEAFAFEARNAWKYEDFVELLVEGVDIISFNLINDNQ